MPAIQYFYLSINFDFIKEDLLNNLIYPWWTIFLNIERMNIFTRCQKYFRAILLAMN